jgi:hypothetical protein
MFVIHIGLVGPEMDALEDLNPGGPKEMSRHRNAELNAVLSTQFRQLFYDSKYRLVNYRTLNEEKGLDAMKRPVIR